MDQALYDRLEKLVGDGDPLGAAAVLADSAESCPARLRRKVLYEAAAALQDGGRNPRRDAALSDALRPLRRVPDIGPTEIRHIHREIAGLFDRFEDSPAVGGGPIPQPTGPFYIVCMTPRSGSTFLARCMTETGILGRPGEYLHRNEPTAMPGITQRFQTPTLDDYIWRVIRHSQTANGVCGIKTDLGSIVPLLVEGTFQRILPYTRFIYLTREDGLAQAISLARAQITGAWNDKVKPAGEVRYSFERTLAALHYITDMTARWEALFAFHGLTPLRITYEDIDRDVDAVIEKISAHIGLENTPPTTFKTRRDSVQRDGASAAWRARFLAEFKSGWP